MIYLPNTGGKEGRSKEEAIKVNYFFRISEGNPILLRRTEREAKCKREMDR